MKKKRAFQSSELVKQFAKIHGFEDQLLAFEVKDFLMNYLDQSLFNEINQIHLKNGVLSIKVQSPLLKHDFQMKRNFFLTKFQERFGAEKIAEVTIS